MRMTPADGCSGFPNNFVPETRIGVLRYDKNDHSDPTTSVQKYGLNCRDEKYENLVPVIPWTIGKPSNERMNLLSCV
jgi:hypothetical protein